MSESSGSGDLFSPHASGEERGRLSLPSPSDSGAVPRQRLWSSPRSPASGDGGEEPQAEGEQPRRPQSAEGAGDERSRRMIRSQYRELIGSVQQMEDNDSDSEGISGSYLPSNVWHKLGEEAEKYFRRAPSFHYMLGSFKSDPPVPRQRIERQKKARGEEKRAMPAQVP